MIEGSYLRTNSELREVARNKLQGNWGMPILACLIVNLLPGAGSFILIIGSIAMLFVVPCLYAGQASFFLSFSDNKNSELDLLFQHFKNIMRLTGAYLLMNLITILWSLLLFIPGIIAAISYSQIFYILAEEPYLPAPEALRKSKDMMNGAKGKFFLMQLSFIGWAFLCLFTFGIGFLWLYPYMQASITEFYKDLKINYRGEYNDTYSRYVQPQIEGTQESNIYNQYSANNNYNSNENNGGNANNTYYSE